MPKKAVSKPIGEKTFKVIQAAVPPALHRQVSRIAQQRGESLSSVAEEFIERGLQGRGLPVLGSIPAGPPVDVDERAIEAYINPGSALRVNPATDFFLRVHGDSMTTAEHGGILDGEFVLLRVGGEYRHRDVVAAYVDGVGFTLKRFCYEGGKVARLEPLNEAHDPIEVPVDELTVQAVCRGKAVKQDGEWRFTPRCN